MEELNQPHDPGFNSPLEESAVAAEIERIQNDPRRRAIAKLQDEILYAVKSEAVALATMKRNGKLIKNLERDLYADYSKPVVRSFVPDLMPRFPFGRYAAALDVAFILSVALIVPGHFTVKPTRAATPESATSTIEAPEPTKPALTDLTTEQVEARIRELAKQANFAWPDYLVRLAKCESGLNPKAVGNGPNVPKSSTDRGLFQINDFHHKEVPDAVAFDLDASTKWTMWRIESGHQAEWTCNAKITKK